MTNTNPSFIPRAAPAESDCAANPGCYQPYTVTISPPTVTGTMTFQLNSSALLGYATNACFSYTVDCDNPLDTAPDYYFAWQGAPFNASTNQDQTVQTSGPVNSVTATVTSRDYGGSAKVSATVNINGIVISASVPSTQELFARIPIDVCKGGVGCRPAGDTSDSYSNGIADSWELSQAGRYLDASEDNEEGWPGSTTRGDGYTAFDEYRGFMIWNGATSVHVRTDPVTTKDVFYYDAAGTATAVGEILQPQTAGPGGMGVCANGANQHPYMQFCQITSWSVQFDPANPYTLTFPQPRHNFTSSGGNRAFAVIYKFASLAPGTLGNSQTIINDGNLPINLDTTQINAVAPQLTFPADVLLAQTVAHETGHKLNLFHPQRQAAFAAVDPAAIGLLGIDQYTADFAAPPAVLLYLWYRDYIYPVGGGARQRSEKVSTDNGALTGNRSTGDIGAPAEVYRPPGADIAVVSLVVSNPLAPAPPAPPDNIWVQIQKQFMMDWTPRLTLQHMADWHFDPADIVNICPQSTYLLCSHP